MDKQIIRERMRQKRRQMMMRRLMRQASLALGGVLLLILLIKGILLPVIGKAGKGKEAPATVEAQAEPQKTNTYAAVRMPLRGAGDASKASVKTAGWQEDAGGRWYRCADGSYYSDGFQEIDGQTYAFDNNGYLQSGWVTADNIDYWFNDDGTYDESKKKPMLALTFDDGPGERTMEILECLEQYDSRATFFMQGVNLETYGKLGAPKKMTEIGCELGNHSYSHLNMREQSMETVSNQFAKVDELLTQYAGAKSTVVRYPYGSYNEDVLNTVQKPSFMWDIDTLDWKTHDADNTYRVVMDNVSDGDIILLHDIHTESVDATLKLIPALVQEGYKLVTLSEMARAKGITLQSTSSYTDFLPATVEELKATQGYTDLTEGEFIDNYSGNEDGDFYSEDGEEDFSAEDGE